MLYFHGNHHTHSAVVVGCHDSRMNQFMKKECVLCVNVCAIFSPVNKCPQRRDRANSSKIVGNKRDKKWGQKIRA